MLYGFSALWAVLLSHRSDSLLHAPAVLAEELGIKPGQAYDTRSIWRRSSHASGSGSPKDYFTPRQADRMFTTHVIIPCSVGTVGRNRVRDSDDLIIARPMLPEGASKAVLVAGKRRFTSYICETWFPAPGPAPRYSPRTAFTTGRKRGRSCGFRCGARSAGAQRASNPVFRLEAEPQG